MTKVQIHDAITGKTTIREATTQEQKEFDDKNAIDYRLDRIRQIRNDHLIATDWWVLRGDITDEQKLFRKNLRDIPTNYNSSEYDELLARDIDEKLTHTVWEKP
tara:strand:- start:1871 stop:2182 length:312 start_codon:yes stop_codon:yes gene_type:complete